MSNEYLDIAIAKVVKQEVNAVLDKIRAEIEQLENVCSKEHGCIAEVLQVIDKYKAESEK